MKVFLSFKNKNASLNRPKRNSGGGGTTAIWSIWVRILVLHKQKIPPSRTTVSDAIFSVRKIGYGSFYEWKIPQYYTFKTTLRIRPLQNIKGLRLAARALWTSRTAPCCLKSFFWLDCVAHYYVLVNLGKHSCSPQTKNTSIQNHCFWCEKWCP